MTDHSAAPAGGEGSDPRVDMDALARLARVSDVAHDALDGLIAVRAERDRLRAERDEARAALARARDDALEDAAKIAEAPTRTGREWISGSLWDAMRKSTAADIRRIAIFGGRHAEG